MDDKDIEYAIRKGEKFTEELKSLIKKYNISVEESDNYNGREEYMSTDYHLLFNGKPYYTKNLREIINECAGKEIL